MSADKMINIFNTPGPVIPSEETNIPLPKVMISLVRHLDLSLTDPPFDLEQRRVEGQASGIERRRSQVSDLGQLIVFPSYLRTTYMSTGKDCNCIWNFPTLISVLFQDKTLLLIPKYERDMHNPHGQTWARRLQQSDVFGTN